MTESKQSSAPKRVAEQLQVMEYGKGGTRNSQVCSGKYETEPSVPALTSWGGAGFARADFTCAIWVPRAGTVMSGTSWMHCGARVESGYSKTWNVSSPTGLPNGGRSRQAAKPAHRAGHRALVFSRISLVRVCREPRGQPEGRPVSARRRSRLATTARKGTKPRCGGWGKRADAREKRASANFGEMPQRNPHKRPPWRPPRRRQVLARPQPTLQQPPGSPPATSGRCRRWGGPGADIGRAEAPAAAGARRGLLPARPPVLWRRPRRSAEARGADGGECAGSAASLPPGARLPALGGLTGRAAGGPAVGGRPAGLFRGRVVSPAAPV